MEAYREQLNRPIVAAAIGFIAGLIIGLVVLGWWLWPVKYTGAGPKDLVPEAKADYLRMAVQSYTLTKNADQARVHYQAVGADVDEVLAQVAAMPGVTPEQVIAFRNAATGVVEAPSGPVATSGPGITAFPTVAPGTTTTSGGSFFNSILPFLCVIVLVIAAGLIVILVTRYRNASVGGGEARFSEVQPAEGEAEWAPYTEVGTEPPMAQFMASYKLGDDLFDDSFSIDSPAGDFMGECGVGISETIGVGEPKKVTAFEVWLFDKTDIQTVTKVFMSAHAYNDEASRQRLAAKGEPVLVEPGTETILDTQALRMVARVVDMGYGDGALPPESYFDRFVIELTAWAKG